MVDGNEEVDAILFEFNVSGYIICVGYIRRCCVLDLKDLLLSGVVRGSKSCPEKLGESRKSTILWRSWAFKVSSKYNDKRLCIVTVTPQVFA